MRTFANCSRTQEMIPKLISRSSEGLNGQIRMLKRVLFLLLALTLAAPAWAATLLPLAEQTFFDNNGAPLAGGAVYFYVPNTLTPKATYQNASGSISNTNPVVLDGSGRAIIYGAGQYRQQVYDANGILIWDQLTADTSGGATFSWAGTSAGTANSQTLSAPNFTLGDGQQIGFIAGFSNSGPLTVVVNGGSPISVVQASATGPQALGSVIAGNQYFLSYSATNGNFQINTLPVQAILPSSPIVAASTTDLGTLASHNANVTGSTTIMSFGNSASITSQFYFATFAASPLITASSSILTPLGANIQTFAGESAFLAYLGGGVWQVISVTGGTPPPPQVTVLTTGTGTYTTPAVNGVKPLYLEVEMIGGGSGGGGSGISTGTAGGASTAGGNTTFGASLTASGGPIAPASGTLTIPTPATATGGDVNIAGGLGQFPSEISTQNSLGITGTGASSPYGAGGSGGGSATPSSTIAAQSPSAPGAGGGPGGAGNATSIAGGFNTGWGGNAGGFVKAIIATPAATYAYVVGAGGAAGTAGTNGQAGAAGAAGLIRVIARWQ